MKQITINYDAKPLNSYNSLREYIGARVHQQFKDGKKYPHKAIAADMDMGQSQLTKKIAHTDGNRLTVDDFEDFLRATRDINLIHYLYNEFSEFDSEEEIKKQIAFLEEKLQKSKP